MKTDILNSELDYFFVDYLSFGTNRLTDFIEDQLLTAYQYGYNRFYKVQAQCIGANIQTERRIETLNKVSVRIEKEYLYQIDFLKSVPALPYDTKIQRVDFAINTKSKKKAFSFLMNGAKGKKKDGSDLYIESEDGQTYYFGDRTGTFFERVYYREDRGFWRYELEFKPRAGRVNKKLSKVHKDILSIWHNICAGFTEIGRECPDELETVGQSRRAWIDTHIESKYVPASKLFYLEGLRNEAERAYFRNRLRHYEDKGRVFEWDILLNIFK